MTNKGRSFLTKIQFLQKKIEFLKTKNIKIFKILNEISK